MTAFQYYKTFCQEWNRMCKDKLVHNEEEYRIAESFLKRIADECHQRDSRNTKLRKQDWEVCARKFTEFCREVKLRFGVDLTESFRKEIEEE